MDATTHVFQVIEECSRCNGTGIYRNVDTLPGAGLICPSCEGNGYVEFRHEYMIFTGKKVDDSIKRVWSNTAGGKLGLESPGGVSYHEWLRDPSSVNEPRAEVNIREEYCPSRMKGVRWKECVPPGMRFDQCQYFSEKVYCWKRFDREERERY